LFELIRVNELIRGRVHNVHVPRAGKLLTIVKEFTKTGNATAMSGDGVNDSLALKQAAIASR